MSHKPQDEKISQASSLPWDSPTKETLLPRSLLVLRYPELTTCRTDQRELPHTLRMLLSQERRYSGRNQ